MKYPKIVAVALSTLLVINTGVGVLASPVATQRQPHQPGLRSASLDFDEMDSGAIVIMDSVDVAANQLAFETAVAFVTSAGGYSTSDSVARGFVQAATQVFDNLNTPQPDLLLGSMNLHNGVEPSPGTIVNAILRGLGRQVVSVRIADLHTVDDRAYFTAEIMVAHEGLQLVMVKPGSVAINRIPNPNRPTGSSRPRTGVYLFNRPVSINFNPNGGHFPNRDSQTVSLRVEEGLSVREHTGRAIAAHAPNPVREGYRFRGWYVDGRRLTVDMPITDNLIAIATWQAIE